MDTISSLPVSMKNILLILFIWTSGQIFAEWIKIKMRNGNWGGKDRRAVGGIMVDQEMLSRVVTAFEKYVKNTAEQTEVLHEQKKVVEQTRSALQEIIELALDPVKKIKEIHAKIIAG